MTTVFDELYFGASLYEKIHGVQASKPRAKGLIELERTLVTRKTLESLTEMLGGARLAMVTGRPYLGTAHSLGKTVMRYFDKGASMFIGDADINPSLRAEYDGYRKPSPKALVRAREKLSSETLLYVGDSAEDLMMVQNARRRGLKGYLFAGVYETSPTRADQASFFGREGSDVIVETVNRPRQGYCWRRRARRPDRIEENRRGQQEDEGDGHLRPREAGRRDGQVGREDGRRVPRPHGRVARHAQPD